MLNTTKHTAPPPATRRALRAPRMMNLKPASAPSPNDYPGVNSCDESLASKVKLFRITLFRKMRLQTIKNHTLEK